MEYNNITDYIRKNMNGLHGDFTLVVTDLSEKEEGCLLVSIRTNNENDELVNFYLYSNGEEEQAINI